MKFIKLILKYMFFIYSVYFMCINFPLISYYVKNSANVCIEAIIPSLFPFFVLSDMILYTMSGHSLGYVIEKIYEKVFRFPKTTIPIFVTGIISGYPVGASAVITNYEKGYISKKDAEDLICFTNNSGPLFIICSVGIGVFKNVRLGIALYVIHIISTVTVGFTISRTRKMPDEIYIHSSYSKPDITKSSEEAFFKCIKISGFVIFFSIINVFIFETFRCFPLLDVILSSVIEITNGIHISSEKLSFPFSLYLASFALGWSGVSVLMQVNSVCKGQLNLKKYVCYKMLNGVISFMLSFLYINYKHINVITNINYNTQLILIILYTFTYLTAFYYLYKKHKLKRKHKL